MTGYQKSKLLIWAGRPNKYIRGGNSGCHPYFAWNNWRPFSVINVCHFYSVTPIYFPLKNCRSFLLVTITFPRVSPLECHPAPFLPVRPRLLTVLCKFSHTNNFSSGVTPYRVSPGAVPLSLMTPLLLIDRQTDMLRQIFSQIANQTIL